MTTFELRPHGWARYGVAAFLAFWLVGWLAGELLVIRAFANLFGHDFDIPFVEPGSSAMPVDLSGLALVVFVVAWFAFWTFGGLAAIGLTLRLLFGRDVIELTPHGWIVRQAVGPLERTIEFHRHDVSQVYLKRNQGAIAALVKGKAVDVSQLGTPEERAIAVERIRAHAGIPAEPARVGAFPPEWAETHGSDGSIVYTHRWGGPRSCLAGCAVIGLACIGFAVVPFFLLGEHPEGAGVAVAIGAGIIALTLLLHTITDQWRVARGRLVIIRRVTFWRQTREIRDASLEVRHSVDDDGDDHATLHARTADGEHRLLSRMNEGPVVASIARRVAEITGWPLEIDPDAEPR